MLRFSLELCMTCQHWLVLSTGGKGIEEAAENRNYLAQRMTDEINEIVRVLQLTTYDEDEWDADDLAIMRKAFVCFFSHSNA